MRRLILIALPLFALACSAPPDSMVSLKPPRDWEERLQAFRDSKDDAFRASPNSPLRAEDVAGFEGLDYWPADSRYYFAGPIHVYAEKMKLEMITNSGQTFDYERFGWIEFRVDGTLRRLQVYRELDTGLGLTVRALLLPFADGTTGKETYPSGRYIEIQGPAGEIRVVPGAGGRLTAAGPFVVDLNRASNPSCAYGAPERFACPVTPKENRLDLRIEAGERGFKLPPDERAG